MSKVGPPVNGDFSDGMAMRTREYLRDDWGEKVGKMFSCDVDHMYASVNDVQNNDREVRELKEMLLVNLDLIQTQSEAIHARDKEIAALKKELDTLRLRFTRMERRVTLQRHKDEPTTPSAALGTAPAAVPPQPALPPPLSTPASIPRLTTPAPPQLTVPLPDPVTSSVSSSSPCSSTPTPSPNLLKRRRVSCVASARRKIRRASSGSDRRKRLRSTSESTETSLSTKEASTYAYTEGERRGRSRAVLTSERDYHTVVGETSWGAGDLHVLLEAVEEKEEEKDQVVVPSWREKVLAPLYVIEGTENVDDEVFLKRHHKLESDERRRKRWDIQRIREQTQLERLKQRVEKRERVAPRPPDRPIHSFYPAADDLEEIAVSPSLPVLAFGVPLRSFDLSEFNLPWTSHGSQRFQSLRNR